MYIDILQFSRPLREESSSRRPGNFSSEQRLVTRGLALALAHHKTDRITNYLNLPSKHSPGRDLRSLLVHALSLCSIFHVRLFIREGGDDQSSRIVIWEFQGYGH